MARVEDADHRAGNRRDGADPEGPGDPDDPDDLLEGGVRTDGGVVHLLADENRPGGWLLTLDRIRQSYVDVDDPTYLDFEYVQGFAEILDAVFPAGQRLDVTHIGGGALMFPRYVHHTRPGSSQIVLEPDAALTAFVRARLPLPARSGIRVRTAYGRPGLAALRTDSADLVVLDAFAGGRVPSDLTTVEALTDVVRVLRPDGLYLANVADGPPLTYSRRLLAGVVEVFADAAVRTDPAVLKPRRFGNVVVAASPSRLPQAEIARRARGAMFPTSTVAGSRLRGLISGAAPLTDADPARSPHPVELAWRVDGGW